MIDRWLSNNRGGRSSTLYWGEDPPRLEKGTTKRIPDANIAERLRARAEERPDAIALHIPSGLDSSGERTYTSLTFRQLDHDVDRICHALANHGLTRGMRTVLMVPPSAEFFSLTFALFRLGAIPVFVDPGMGLPSLKDCLGRARPEAFIGIPKAQIARLLFGWGRGSVRFPITVGSRVPFGGPPLEKLRRRTEPRVRYDGPNTRSDEMAAILFTSGSTGTPKGAVYHHAIFPAQVDQLARHYEIEPGEIDLPTFPLFGLFDVALGMTAVVPSMDFTRPGKADPEELRKAIERFQVTNLFASPALLKNLARHAEKENVNFPTLRRVLSAGAPVPASEIARLAGRLSDGAEVHTPYGATESLPVATIGSGELLSETREKTTAGAGVCVGKPLPEIEVRIIEVHDRPLDSIDEAVEVAPGEVGELCVRGTIVSREYFDHEEGNRLGKITDGETVWHRMGDLVRADEQGRLWFQGRKAHRVWTADGPLDTIATESVFNEHPAVARTALIGLGPQGRQLPVLCVEKEAGGAGNGISDESLFAELRALGEKAGLPPMSSMKIHPEFPVDIRHNAKIFREKLVTWVGEAR